MKNNFKLNVYNSIVSALALIFVITLNVTAGTQSILDILRGEAFHSHPYCDFIMFYWIFVFSVGATVVLALINRYDFAVISSVIAAVSCLIIYIGTENIDEFVFILHTLISVGTFVTCLLAKKKFKEQQPA